MTTKIITNEVLIIQEKAKILFEPFLSISDTKTKKGTLVQREIKET